MYRVSWWSCLVHANFLSFSGQNWPTAISTAIDWPTMEQKRKKNQSDNWNAWHRNEWTFGKLRFTFLFFFFFFVHFIYFGKTQRRAEFIWYHIFWKTASRVHFSFWKTYCRAELISPTDRPTERADIIIRKSTHHVCRNTQDMIICAVTKLGAFLDGAKHFLDGAIDTVPLYVHMVRVKESVCVYIYFHAYIRITTAAAAAKKKRREEEAKKFVHIDRRASDMFMCSREPSVWFWFSVGCEWGNGCVCMYVCSDVLSNADVYISTIHTRGLARQMSHSHIRNALLPLSRSHSFAARRRYFACIYQHTAPQIIARNEHTTNSGNLYNIAISIHVFFFFFYEISGFFSLLLLSSSLTHSLFFLSVCLLFSIYLPCQFRIFQYKNPFATAGCCCFFFVMCSLWNNVG